MTAETAITKDAKTLVWFGAAGAPALAASSWMRWDVAAESVAAARALTAQGIQPDLVLCLDACEACEAWFAEGHWSKARLVILPKSLIEAIGFDAFMKYRMNNVLCLDEAKDLYSFAGPAWDGTLEDAKALIALILRTHRSFPVQPPPARASVAIQFGVKFSAVLETPAPLVFLTQFYVPEKAKRRREIVACLEKNLHNPMIDRVVLLNETPCVPEHLMRHAKLTEQVIGRRLQYSDVFQWIHREAPTDALVVFANADIFLDEIAGSWRALWAVDMHMKFLALLRWEVEGTTADMLAAAKPFGPRPDSQDTWVVSAASVRAAAASAEAWNAETLAFPFGKGGCDNAITVEMLRKRFTVSNPAFTLKTYHYHSSKIRDYDPRDIVDKPAYMYVTPTGLHDMTPLYHLEGASGLKGTTKQFAPLRYRVEGPLTAAQARTFCSMVKRTTEDSVVLSADSETVWQPPPVALYETGPVFQTNTGLLYTYKSILVGKTKAAAEAWATSQMSSLSASLKVDHALVAPISDAVAKDPAAYLLDYLAKILVLRSQSAKGAQGEFWCSKDKAATDVLKAFRWGMTEVPILSRTETEQAYCDSATAWFAQDWPVGAITHEEVAALRERLAWGGGWRAEHDTAPRRLVIAVNGEACTQEAADMIERALADTDVEVTMVWPETDLQRLVTSLQGAWGLVASGMQVAAWSWCMPTGSFVWEIQSEMRPSAKILQLAAAAGLRHRLFITPKGLIPKTKVAEMMMRKLAQDICEHAAPPQAAAQEITKQRPLITMPRVEDRASRYYHAGDSFREMVRLWAEKGYVRVEESATAKHVWLGSEGTGTLLYDRPTPEWLDEASSAKAAKILFGNPEPPAALGPKARSWIFWPRRPRLVEDAVEAGLGRAAYGDRKHGLVFYGRSENAVQLSRRTTEDWASACDVFQHEQGAAGKPYALSPMEYLKSLAAARFGLCLAGYGRKCHREVECMAMGCVPFVAPEVDMDSYSEPLIEGTHYIRVNNPKEAITWILNITEAHWTDMSAACRAWWQRNASVEGSWETTRRLCATY